MLIGAAGLYNWGGGGGTSRDGGATWVLIHGGEAAGVLGADHIPVHSTAAHHSSASRSARPSNCPPCWHQCSSWWSPPPTPSCTPPTTRPACVRRQGGGRQGSVSQGGPPERSLQLWQGSLGTCFTTARNPLSLPRPTPLRSQATAPSACPRSRSVRGAASSAAPRWSRRRSASKRAGRCRGSRGCRRPKWWWWRPQHPRRQVCTRACGGSWLVALRRSAVMQQLEKLLGGWCMMRLLPARLQHLAHSHLLPHRTPPPPVQRRRVASPSRAPCRCPPVSAMRACPHLARTEWRRCARWSPSPR